MIKDNKRRKKNNRKETKSKKIKKYRFRAEVRWPFCIVFILEFFFIIFFAAIIKSDCLERVAK